jgi:hypothetical protein
MTRSYSQLARDRNWNAQPSETGRSNQYDNVLYKAWLCAHFHLYIYILVTSSSRNDSHYIPKAKEPHGVMG